ncbi:hypothetical protein SAMN06265795_12218 [Noviherbaspirillum humi]|uniref:Uncharacterized protein n=1 Tax=Noviherbaspirillum humi TaxID=1688639 RepID=A0A239LD95_9BURK|nr:hypothetical protein [Noviherbaspirillum humi]SNT28626.1 hypothetical protein SAMN06265795_12218 [Noviherbaspirillum humi]
MSRDKKKRTKVYRPKHIQIPVMPDLQREFMLAAHASLATLRLAPSLDAFDNLADLFNTVYVAARDAGHSITVLESGMRALQTVGDRHDEKGALAIARFELPPIENAVFECERLVPLLDIFGLYKARLKAQALQRMNALQAPLEAA